MLWHVMVYCPRYSVEFTMSFVLHGFQQSFVVNTLTILSEAFRIFFDYSLGVVSIIFSSIISIDILGETATIGALITYMCVHVCVIVVR